MIAIMFITIGVSLVLYFKNFKNFPANAKDEFLSREFWMYLGSIILVLSSLQILISTSVPVINKIFGSEIAPPLDVVGFYNRWQLPFAVLILIITSVSLVLRYGKNDIPSFLKRFGITLVTANVLFVAQLLIFDISTLPNFLFLVTINLAIVSSVDYLIRNKFNLYNLSNTLSHLGIAMFLMGVLVAFSTSKVISTNTSRFDLGDAQTNKENQLLQRNQKKELNEYIVEYTTRRQEGNHLFYGMEFYKLDKDGNPVKDFTVEPSINVNKRMGNVYDPDTYHSFEKDVFTYITYADIEADMTNDRFKELIEKPISVGDTLRVDGYPVVLDSIRVEGNSVAQVDVNNVAIIATLHIIGKRESTGKFELAYRITNGEISKSYHIVEDIGIRFRFVNINAESQGMIIAADKQDMEFIVVKSTVFPYISIMWIGVFITVIGLSLSLYRNIKLSHKK
jgi:cytochrome c-type biogenesis protein CcmF